MTRNRYTREELAEAVVFPIELDEIQAATARAELSATRNEARRHQTELERRHLNLLQLKFQMEDHIEGSHTNTGFNFSYFLRQYIDVFNIKRKVFASEISIDDTLLSQFINRHRLPPDYVFIRLELHSNNIIPAHYWFRLVEKEKEHQIRTDTAFRERERKFVHPAYTS